MEGKIRMVRGAWVSLTELGLEFCRTRLYLRVEDDYGPERQKGQLDYDSKEGLGDGNY